MVNIMGKDNKELIATLNAIYEVVEKLSVKDEHYRNVAKVAKRIAELEKKGFSEEMVMTILYMEGYIPSEELYLLLQTN